MIGVGFLWQQTQTDQDYEITQDQNPGYSRIITLVFCFKQDK